MRPFRSLSTRLTVQFALLFAAAMLAVSAALSTFISSAASREVESQLQSSGAVYDRLWQQRAHELQNAAQLLARDFGFRAAVATGDEATMQSALGNAAARLKVRSAFIVTADGKVTAIDRTVPAAQTEGLWDALDSGRLTGVSSLPDARASSSPRQSWRRRSSAGWCSPPILMRGRCAGSSGSPQSRCMPQSSPRVIDAGRKRREACRR